MTLNCTLALMAAGAVYVAAAPLAVLVGAMVPQPGEQEVPFWVSVQLTPLLLESLLTVAVKVFVCPWSIVWAALGETATLIAGGGGCCTAPEPLQPPMIPAAMTAATNAIHEFLFPRFMNPPSGFSLSQPISCSATRTVLGFLHLLRRLVAGSLLVLQDV
jgi:hypothetical protein